MNTNGGNTGTALRDPMVFSRIHRNVSVLLRNDLNAAEGTENNSPLEHFSKFANITVIVIADGKRLEYKMPPEKWLYFKAEYSQDRILDEKAATSEKGTGLDPKAYEPLKFSSCRGQSIVDVVNNGANVQQLYNELMDGRNKYKRNAEFLNILQTALRLKQTSGPIKKSGKKLSQLYPDVGPAISPRPNLYKAYPDGSCPGNECTITWEHGDSNNYPVTISVRKCRYRANKLQDGRLQTTNRQVVDAVNVSLTRAEWIKLVSDACFQINQFKAVQQQLNFQRLKKMEEWNRQNYRNQSNR